MGSPLDVLRFELDGQPYGLPATEVLELLRAATPASLPGAPAVILGVLNVRGQIVPVYDVRGRFAMKPRPLSPDDAMIVVRVATDRTAAIVVDRALDLVVIEPDALRAAPHAGPRHVGGLAALSDGTLVILELATFLEDHEKQALAAALGELDKAASA